MVLCAKQGGISVQLDYKGATDMTDIFDKNNISDEELVLKARAGNSLALEILMFRYKNYVKYKTNTYYLTGGDNDDIIQEGYIGLYKALRDFDFDKMTSFKVFAEVCITRQIITAIKTATRQKHIPLNSSLSLNKPIYCEDNSATLLDIIMGGERSNPELLFIVKEEIKNMEDLAKENLSKLEYKVFQLYIDGLSYEEMSLELGRDEKSIDNALQRIKKKLSSHI